MNSVAKRGGRAARPFKPRSKKASLASSASASRLERLFTCGAADRSVSRQLSSSSSFSHFALTTVIAKCSMRLLIISLVHGWINTWGFMIPLIKNWGLNELFQESWFTPPTLSLPRHHGLVGLRASLPCPQIQSPPQVQIGPNLVWSTRNELWLQGSAKRSAYFVKQQPGRERQKS